MEQPPMARSEPVRFSSRHELIEYLRAPETAEWASDFVQRDLLGLHELVVMSVASNTFRAFPIKHITPPSLLYRNWAERYLRQRLDQFTGARGIEEYGAAVVDAAAALCKHWSRETRGEHEVGLGRAAKMLNLTLKHLVLLKDLSQEERTRLWTRLHVPLDSYTIQGVASFAPPALVLGRGGTMNAVRDRRQYGAIQEWIRGLCAEAGVPPIMYEILAYNMAHPKTRSTPVAAPAPEHARVSTPPRARASAAGRRPRPGAPKEPPRVDGDACPVDWRTVYDAAVGHVIDASYRGARFSGTFEIADGSAHRAGRIPCHVRWYGREAVGGYVSIDVRPGQFLRQDHYTGPVIANLGRRLASPLAWLPPEQRARAGVAIKCGRESRTLRAAVFYVKSAGVFYGNYYGYEGGGCFAENYFKLTLDDSGEAASFWVCHDPTDSEFYRELSGNSDSAVHLEEVDRQALQIVAAVRGAWLEYDEEGDVMHLPQALILGGTALGEDVVICDGPVDRAVLTQISHFWSLHEVWY